MLWKKLIKRIAIAFIVGFAIVVSLVFLGRNWLLNFAIGKVQSKLNASYNLTLIVKNAKINGLNKVNIDKTSVLFKNDTILSIDKISLTPKLRFLFTKKLVFETLRLQTLQLKINLDSLQTLRKTNQPLPPSATEKLKIPEKIHRIMPYLQKALKWEPQKIVAQQINLQFQKNGHLLSMHLDSLYKIEDKLNVKVSASDSLRSYQCTVGGLKKENVWRVSVNSNLKDSAETALLPLWILNNQYTVQAGFKEVEFELEKPQKVGKTWLWNVAFSLKNAVVGHWRLASEPTLFESLKAQLQIKSQAQHLELDSSSTISIQDFQTQVFAWYKHLETRQIHWQLASPKVAANVFFSALPYAIFPQFKGIDATGDMRFYHRFFIDLDTKDTVDFDAGIDSKNLQINAWGAINPARFNQSFEFRPYASQRLLWIGPENSKYTPAYEMARYIPYAIMCSEDGDFLYHKGFIMEAIKKSILANANAKRFVRGGSTISMQLVKNLLLTRDKNLARKLEEALWVWLIHHKNIINKERQLELYLNIIEWGPDIYGIGEAAYFYFNKSPQALSLSEAIFLAMIIPNPKGFKWHFEPDGQLKANRHAYFEKVAGIMLKREYISEDTYQTLNPSIRFTGAAKNYISPPDSQEPSEDWDTEP